MKKKIKNPPQQHKGSHSDFSGDFLCNINWISNTHIFIYLAGGFVSH